MHSGVSLALPLDRINWYPLYSTVMSITDPEPIHPFKVYTAKEAADILRVDRTAIYDAVNKGELETKDLGKGYKFLGETLLRFMGSATVNQMQPNAPSLGGTTPQMPDFSTTGVAVPGAKIEPKVISAGVAGPEVKQ